MNPSGRRPSSSSCPHKPRLSHRLAGELQRCQEKITCEDCSSQGPNLWICLYEECLHVGCSEKNEDHSTLHYEQNPTHCVHMNVMSRRAWCHECKCEVFPFEPDSSLALGGNASVIGNSRGAEDRFRSVTTAGLDRGPGLNVSSAGDSQDSSGVDDDDGPESGLEGRPRGLVGLQNIGNTCYMNSAIQALSNTPQLTQYFLDCAAAVDFLSDEKSSLSRCYQKLVKEMWNKESGGFVVPSRILYGIRTVHPTFRGYHQHDTQEFLRCFMDQLHEELKEPVKNDKNTISSNFESSYVTKQPKVGVTGDENVRNSKPRHQLHKVSAKSSDNIPSSVVNHGYHRMHSNSETSSAGTMFMNGHKRSASYCDSRGYSQIFHENNLSNNIVNNCDLDSSEHDDDEDSTYQTCDSGVSDSASVSDDEHVHRPTTKTFKRISESSENADRYSNGRGGDHPASTVSYRSIISDIFDGRLLSSVECLTCNRISTRVETFQDLSLPIPSRDHMAVLGSSSSSNSGQGSPRNGRGAACTDAVYSASSTHEGWVWWLFNLFMSWFYGPAVTLHNCLAAFFSADELKGDNMYSCEKCNRLRNGVKFSKLLSLPEVLCIHLKRFRHELMSSSKIGAKVLFPLTGLDMRPYLHKEYPSTVSTYDLVAVICHAGNAGGGHYTCVAKNQHTGRWYEFDDQYVTGVTPEQVAACEAYVLFYKKSNPNMIKLREKAAEIYEESLSRNDVKYFISKQWISRFTTYAEPGPVDNSDFLCPHNGVPPEKVGVVERLTTIISQPLWEFFYENFGGSPPCTQLHICSVCQIAAEKLKMRQTVELQTYTTLQNQFQMSQIQELTTAIYAINMNWFRLWQSFVYNKTQQPPPAIDNSGIVTKSQDGKQVVIKPGSDHAPISEEVWKFFYDIYGGGPEVVLRPALNNTHIVEKPPPSSKNIHSKYGRYSLTNVHSYGDSHDNTILSSMYKRKHSNSETADDARNSELFHEMEMMDISSKTPSEPTKKHSDKEEAHSDPPVLYNGHSKRHSGKNAKRLHRNSYSSSHNSSSCEESQLPCEDVEKDNAMDVDAEKTIPVEEKSLKNLTNGVTNASQKKPSRRSSKANSRRRKREHKNNNSMENGHEKISATTAVSTTDKFAK